MKVARCGFVVLLMAVFWMTEAVPLAVTSLIPVMLLPLLGVMSTSDVCIVYLKETNMMFVGGLVVAIAIEHCNLHKRIALKVLLLVGTSPRLLMLGFMLNTMFLSMWISNTACTAMMVPIVTAVLDELRDSNLNVVNPSNSQGRAHQNSGVDRNGSVVPAQNSKDEEKRFQRSNICYYLGVAYAANIGGTGTITGTGTNLTFMGVYLNAFPNQVGLNFASWMLFNVPVMLVNVVIAWLWLQFMYMGLFRGGCCSKGENDVKSNARAVRQLISSKYDELGPMTWHEGNVLVLFVALVLLWFFRQPEFIPGWADFLSPGKIKDSTPAMCIVFLLFALPADLKWLSLKPTKFTSSPPLLNWQVTESKLPWGLILLLGGGFAMAEASKVSGLSAWLGLQLAGLAHFPTYMIVTIICLMSTFATEVSSNTAIANILLPVLAEMAKAIRVHPLTLMMPATLCCSYSFMLPVATPPNAIVAAASNMKTRDMIRSGLMMNLFTVGVLVFSFNTLGVVVYQLDQFPSWADDLHGVSSTTAAAVLNATSVL
ncbi:hypothetical protein B566_EDAN011242 [Ephemera danica]|nr:hypothetical protein B566_EDAN011242 [Ephemera danica]